MFCWKILIFFGEILIILWTFLQNFIQKYKFYIWVYFKGGTKSEVGKFLSDWKLKKIFRGTKMKIWHIYKDKKKFNSLIIVRNKYHLIIFCFYLFTFCPYLNVASKSCEHTRLSSNKLIFFVFFRKGAMSNEEKHIKSIMFFLGEKNK